MSITKINTVKTQIRFFHSYIFFLLFALLFACKSNTIEGNGTENPSSNKKTIVDVEISVLANVNSTKIVKNSLLKVFESKSVNSEGNTSKPALLHTINIQGKTVQLQLQIGKRYDFVMEPSKTLVASAIKNFKVPSNLTHLSIIQLEKRLPNREAKLPELTSFYAQLKEGEVELKDGASLPLPLNAKVHASIFSRGGASQKLFNRDFATKLGFDSTPSSLKLQAHPLLSGIEPEASETIEKDNGWENNFIFNIQAHNMAGKDEVDFVLVCYDVVGNRLEHHTTVKFSHLKYKAYPNNDIKFFNMNCNIKSTHSSMHLYSTTDNPSIQSYIHKKSIGEKNIYYFPNFSFEVMKDYIIEIAGMQLLRRNKEGAVNNAEALTFLKVSEVLYDREKLGLHVIADTYSGLKLDETYEYKIRILLKEGFYVDSPIIPIKMLLPFEVELLAPSNHKTIHSLDEFSFKVLSDNGKTQDIFSPNNADYFAFGLIINSFNGECVFLNTFKYYLDPSLPDDERLEVVSKNGNFRSLKELKQELNELKNKKLQDFINIDEKTGIVKIKKDAIIYTNRADNTHYIKNMPYYWDIVFCKVAGNASAIKKLPCAFFKESKIEQTKITASSHAHIVLSTSYTLNGAFTFSIDDGKDDAGTIIPSCIVKIKDGCSLDFLKNLNAKVVNSLKISDASDETYYHVIFSDTKQSIEKNNEKSSIDILSSLLSYNGVISAEYDTKLELIKDVHIEEMPIFSLNNLTFRPTSSAPTLNDPLLRSVCYSLDITSAYQAYKEFGFGVNPVIVAIMDSGINESHEDLNTNGKSIIEKFDNDIFDTDGHGTHCAGIIAGLGNNNLGIAGVSWKNTKLVVLRFNENSTFATYKKISDFVDYVMTKRNSGELEQKTIALNMSFGSPYPHLIALEMIEKALNAGVLPIVAMGNTGSTLLNYPAAYPGVIAVGSSNARDKLSSFSSRGEHISIVAPGEAIMSLGKNYPEHYQPLHGTSMATPFVSGTISYLMSFKPELNPFQVKTILEKTADKIENNETFNSRRGYGRINVYEAAKQAKSKEGMQNKFFKGAVKIHAIPYSPKNLVSIYSDNEICIFASRFHLNGSLTLKGLLPGKYKVYLNKGEKIERKEFQILADDENDVNLVF